MSQIVNMIRRAIVHRALQRSQVIDSGRKKVVILGTGWGSYSALRNIDKSRFDVIVVSPRNHFLFTPLLASTTVGTLEFRSIIEPIRNIGFRQDDHFHLAEAKTLDTEHQLVECENILNPRNAYTVSYDYLIIGVGAVSNTFGVPGVQQHAFFLKEVSDARKIRDRILSNFELAVAQGATDDDKRRLLHTVIVGGGPTGVEFGAELYDFIQQDVSRLYKSEKEMIKVTLVESNKILSSFDKRLQAYAEKKIQTRDQFSIAKSAVTEVSKDSVTLKDGSVLPCGLVVWSTGIAPRPFVKSLTVPKSPHGQILTSEHLEVLEIPQRNVFALGDCAHIQNLPLPCTAQVAEKQGRYLAGYLNAIGDGANGRSHPPFHFISLGMLAYIGSYQALSDLPEVKLRGYTSWFLWRSAYLTRLGSWRLRMQVPLDWLKTFLFGRDISRF